MKLTEQEYKCCGCGKTKRLVIVRDAASLCKDCYAEHLAKRRAMRELNQIASEMLR